MGYIDLYTYLPANLPTLLHPTCSWPSFPQIWACIYSDSISLPFQSTPLLPMPSPPRSPSTLQIPSPILVHPSSIEEPYLFHTSPTGATPLTSNPTSLPPPTITTTTPSLPHHQSAHWKADRTPPMYWGKLWWNLPVNKVCPMSRTGFIHHLHKAHPTNTITRGPVCRHRWSPWPVACNISWVFGARTAENTLYIRHAANTL